MVELRNRGLNCKIQVPIAVNYNGEAVGDYLADIIVEDKIILEIKAQENIGPGHKAQTLNYLKATETRIGLLINFTHPKAQVERFVL